MDLIAIKFLDLAVTVNKPAPGKTARMPQPESREDRGETADAVSFFVFRPHRFGLTLLDPSPDLKWVREPLTLAAARRQDIPKHSQQRTLRVAITQASIEPHRGLICCLKMML